MTPPSPEVANISTLLVKRAEAAAAIVGPARSALAAMLDANLKRSAEPLSEALFKFDAVDQEINAAVEALSTAGRLELLAPLLRPPK